MSTNIDNELERIIEQKLLQRFETHKHEEIQVALYAVADDLRANGYPDIGDQLVYQVYVNVMSY